MLPEQIKSSGKRSHFPETKFTTGSSLPVCICALLKEVEKFGGGLP